ncbi:hypothetical protein [Nocardia sp. NPDC050412]|uniref:hypothetical protein n=1 Tax=Nocardia sp. NPDC050412 TaxID=3364320 RepID=UPI0037B24E7E
MTLTQPWATIITGALAVVAASIAYLGVLKNLADQRRRENRTRAIEHLVEAATVMEEQPGHILANIGPGGMNSEFYLADNRLRSAAIKLQLFGFDEASHAVLHYGKELLEVIVHQDATNDDQRSRKVTAARDEALNLLIAARKTAEGS